MNCNTCGAAVEAAAGFCHHCGAPIGGGTAVAVATAESPIRFTLEAGALELFGRNLLMILSFPFIIPAPWTICWFTKWLAGEVRASDGEALEFRGTAGTVWKLVALYVLLVGVSISLGVIRGDEQPSIATVSQDVLLQLAALALGWGFLKWAVNHLEWNSRRWRFDGSIWGFLGWYLLLYVSVLTIIGWAWASVGLYNWIAEHVQDAGGTMQFVGAGHQMLWRTIVFVLFCVPILTIPWAIKWYYAWLISQLQLTQGAEA